MIVSLKDAKEVALILTNAIKDRDAEIHRLRVENEKLRAGLAKGNQK